MSSIFSTHTHSTLIYHFVVYIPNVYILHIYINLSLSGRIWFIIFITSEFVFHLLLSMISLSDLFRFFIHVHFFEFLFFYLFYIYSLKTKSLLLKMVLVCILLLDPSPPLFWSINCVMVKRTIAIVRITIAFVIVVIFAKWIWISHLSGRSCTSGCPALLQPGRIISVWLVVICECIHGMKTRRVRC